MGIRVVRSPMVLCTGEEDGDTRCSVRLTLNDGSDSLWQEFGLIYGPTIALAAMRADLVVDALNNNLKRIGIQ